MRIAHITATFPPNYTGTGMVCYHNALELARRGHHVTVFTAAYPPGNCQYPEEITVRRLPVLFRFGNAPFLPGLPRALRGFDLIHLHHPFIFGDILVWLASRLWKTPYTLTHHNDLIGIGLRKYMFYAYTSLVTRRVFSDASKLAAVSKDHAAHCRLAPRFCERWEDVVEIPNGVDTDLFHLQVNGGEVRRKLGITEGEKIVLFVGALDRAHHFKGFERLMRAFAMLDYPLARLMIAGDGDLRGLYQDLASELSIEERTIFLGAIPNWDLPPYYAAADVTVLPSSPPESFGMVLIEAMACGKPVIASDLPGVRTVVSDHQDGLLVKPGNPVDLAAKLSRLLEWPAEKRWAMGSSGRAKVVERYAWGQIGEKLEGIYQEVIEKSERLSWPQISDPARSEVPAREYETRSTQHVAPDP